MMVTPTRVGMTRESRRRKYARNATVRAAVSARLQRGEAFEGIPALLDADEVVAHHPRPVVVPEHAPDGVVDDDLLGRLGRRHALPGVGLVVVLLQDLVERGVLVERRVGA